LGLTQFFLHRIEIVAVAHGDARRPVGAVRVLVGLVGHHDDRRHALGGDLARDHRRVERAVVALPAGHRDRVVVEDLVGHAHLRRHGGADREQAGVEVRAVAEVGEDVLLVRERRLADPRRALRPHVREGGGLAVHPHRHEVAADARRGAAAFGDARGSVVRAAGAEIRLPDRGDAGLGQRLLFEVEEGKPFLELASQRRIHVQFRKALRDGAGDHRGRMLVVRRQQPRAGGLAAAAAPLAAVVELADDARRAHAFLPAVELFLDLVLDQLALFLDHQDLFQALGEALRALRLERPGHRHFVDA
jgi:hypothetical protein